MINPNSTRKLWVLQGCRTQLLNQINAIINQYPGDWITVTMQTDLSDSIHHYINPNQTKSLLGQEFKHAIFDATDGFNLDAFAMLAGTLIKNSVLILLLPESYSNWVDRDSLRWNESITPIMVPNFIRHLQQTLLEFAHVDMPIIQSLDNQDSDVTQQQIVLTQLLQSDSSLNILIAKRGRGKSALAGLFTHHRRCWVTAPNKNALVTFFQFAEADISFYAPDQLTVMNDHQFPDWIIIDEAAMIPLPMLEKILQLALSKQSKILLTTTVEGYEGTGQGFLLKLLKTQFTKKFYLDKPIRWQDNDDLERLTDKLLLNGVSTNYIKSEIDEHTISYSITERHDIDALKSIFYLLKMAHYQTTLVEDVWRGIRRPKGNLVAQSLVAHAGEKLAAKLKSVRINRIAVIEPYRRQKIARHLVQHIYQHATINDNDFISVSFAYSEANYQFWLACGFVLVHIASHKQANSGSYSMMAIKPITQQGHLLTQRLVQRLQRNAYWLASIIDLPFNQLLTIDDQQNLSLDDYQVLQGFCDYHRPFEACYASLCRLANTNVNHSKTPMPLLKALVLNKISESELIKQYQLTGRNQLIKSIKHEVKSWFMNNQPDCM